MRSTVDLAPRAHGAPPRSGGRSASIVEVYERYGVPYRVDEARGGWVSAHCPHCRGSADFHLGFSLERHSYRCWRCGSHPTIDTLVALCRITRAEAAEIYRGIAGGTGAPDLAARAARDRDAQRRVSISRYRRPGDLGPMGPRHRRYLEGRGFDPDRIEREWGVLGTGPASYLDETDYRNRLFLPITWDGAEVSHTARDVSGRSDIRYLSCPADREQVPHKHILYGRQRDWGPTGIVVEGPTDCWRLGAKACAVFGINYTPEQLAVLARLFRRVAVVFDPEPAAQRQARRLAASLRVRLGTDPVVVDWLGEGVDPGSMSQDDADHLVRELTR